jgi:hypothetical protein
VSSKDDAKVLLFDHPAKYFGKKAINFYKMPSRVGILIVHFFTILGIFLAYVKKK